MSAHRLAWLFDIDGTLLHTDGVAREAFVHAVRAHLGVEDDLRDIEFAGRTEPLIMGDILRKHGRAGFADGEEPRFWTTVFAEMRARFGPGRGGLFPGVPELLEAVDREPWWVPGLLTGNMTEMARIKLGRVGLGGRFAFGAFGEEAPDRDRLACLAVERVAAAYGLPPSRCIVIGDTEHDVTCARAAGAHVIAVATGSRSRATLAAHAPDLLLDDLSDVASVVAWARGIEARADG
jgi:phosphoglycolate phosphatase